MKCERCKATTKAYELHDYCEACSKNLCVTCMAEGRCVSGAKHIPANHGGDDECPTCIGHGRIRDADNTYTLRRCLDCNGSGTLAASAPVKP